MDVTCYKKVRNMIHHQRVSFLIWNVQIGVYNSLSEGLDALAYQWGKYSDEFKRSLMRIRASVIENTEAKRYALLDQIMSDMLESIRNKMEQYARDLSQPSTMLFYIGVLLPLLLIIILHLDEYLFFHCQHYRHCQF